MAKVGAWTIGGNCPAKRDPSSGSSPSRIGFLRVMVESRQVAIVRMTASARLGCILPIGIIFFPRHSCHSVPSALRRISIVLGSASAVSTGTPRSRRSFSSSRFLCVCVSSCSGSFTSHLIRVDYDRFGNTLINYAYVSIGRVYLEGFSHTSDTDVWLL